MSSHSRQTAANSAKYAEQLAACGVRRVNVSLDTLDPEKFLAITRWGKFDKVMEGIDAATAAGIKIKINCVALKGVNDDEIHNLVRWCGEKDMTSLSSKSCRWAMSEAKSDWINTGPFRWSEASCKSNGL